MTHTTTSSVVADTAARVRLADNADREAIYRLRHETYAAELGQHEHRDDGRLTDALDADNVYVMVEWGTQLAGFVSLSNPATGRLSLDKYVPRTDLPFDIDATVFEMRLLTIAQPFRRRGLIAPLLYAGLRYAEHHGASRVVIMGRDALVPLYERIGFSRTDISFASGAVTYTVLSGTTAELRRSTDALSPLQPGLDAMEWALPFSKLPTTAACFHGGSSITVVGDAFEKLSRRKAIVNADVLDAWFPPSPGVLAAVTDQLEWALRTSPPALAAGLLEAIARERNVPPTSLVAGAGSSALIYLALREWLTSSSRVLLLDPTYGEYDHVLRNVIGCPVKRLPLRRDANYDVPVVGLVAAASECQLVIIVNPNSPTGRAMSRAELAQVVSALPPTTLVWIDETYIDYADASQSMESIAAASSNVVVCKSMSKAYALSGARVAYLCGAPELVRSLRKLTPPWAVGLVAQLAAVTALGDRHYYTKRYAETATLRGLMTRQLRDLGLDVVEGCANFVLAHLPAEGRDAAGVVRACQADGVYLRDASSMGRSVGSHALRVASRTSLTSPSSSARFARHSARHVRRDVARSCR